MGPSASSSSPPSTDGRPVCRFCLDADESVSGMIRPCNCRGTVALVHPSCLEMWVQASKNLVCQMCQIAYEQESAGLKKISEWTFPKPPPEFPYEIIFNLMLLWVAYVFVLLFVFVTFGFSGMMTWIDYHYLILYGACFLDVFLPYRRNATRLAKNWYHANTVYKFKDMSTEEERKMLDAIEIHPGRCYFCPEGILTIGHLIRHCSCRGVVVHSLCMEEFFGSDHIGRLVCSHCNDQIYQERVGWRKFSEWTWPEPISDSLVNKAEFYIVFAFTFYLLRLVIVWIALGNYKMMTWMVGHAYWVFWGILFLFSIALSCEAFLVAREWYAENTEYKFKDRRIVLERKELN